MRVKDIPNPDRPREKLIQLGAQNLTDSELLAILLRTGTKGVSVIEVSQNLIQRAGNLSVLASKSVSFFKEVSGIGKDKAVTLLAAFEISRRVSSKAKWFSQLKITSPSDVADIYIPLFRDELQEKFTVVCLNSSNRIIRHSVIFVGSLNSSVVHPREVFREAIQQSSASIILLHNHPSGNPDPSNEDIAVTKKLVEAGKMLDIPVFDHIILAGDKYTSFVEKRLI